MINPLAATNRLTDELYCNVCEQYKPLRTMAHQEHGRFKDVSNHTFEWGLKVRIHGIRYQQVCPDCMMMYGDYLK